MCFSDLPSTVLLLLQELLCRTGCNPQHISCCEGDLEVRQCAIISALLFLDAASDFSSMSLVAGKARPAHDRAAPLLDQDWSPGSSDVRHPAEIWIRPVSLGFACFLGSVFALAAQDAACGFSEVEKRERPSKDTAPLVLSSSGGCFVACFCVSLQ